MRSRLCAAGLSLIEVLVTLVVIAVGLLGLAKMQAAALSNTQVARMRSLVALQAASLAAAMRANRAFWATAPRSFSAAGTVVTDASGALNTEGACHAQACTPTQLAAYDVKSWIASLNTSFPGYSAAVSCAGSPVNCDIDLTWTEKVIAINKSTATTPAGQAGVRRFTLHVLP
jgi:type IV pilus assembly protein PilV